MSSRIFLSFPHLSGNEMKWIDKAFQDKLQLTLDSVFPYSFQRFVSDLILSHNFEIT